MILVIDVGNTNITLGVFDGETLLGNWRMTTQIKRTSDESGIFICSLLENNGIDVKKIKHVMISSVVPNIMYSLENGIKKYIHVVPIIVGPGIKTGISIKTDNPREVGADRIVDIVAAYNIYGGACIVIDFGTATTYDVVKADASFCAAITSPGIQISADALWNRAAQLPHIKIRKPDSILATNTVTSMQAGLVYGYIGQVEYIVKRIKKELNIEDIKVVATGGLAKIIKDDTEVIDIYDPLLTLKGLKILCEKNIDKG